MTGDTSSRFQHLLSAAVAAASSPDQQQWLLVVLGWAALSWYAVVTVICWLGYIQV